MSDEKPKRGPHRWTAFAPVDVAERRRRVFVCPGCNAHEFDVEHIFRDGIATFGPWYCEHCGAGWHGAQMRGGLSLRPADNRARRVRIVLELRPHTEPLRFTIDTTHVVSPGDDQEEEIDSIAYLYEEHICPKSWLREVTEVSLGDEIDPHRLVELVSVEDGP